MLSLAVLLSRLWLRSLPWRCYDMFTPETDEAEKRGVNEIRRRIKGESTTHLTRDRAWEVIAQTLALEAQLSRGPPRN